MAHLIDLPAVPRDEAEARERSAAYAESWRAAAFSTEPADRDAAEAAIIGLYRNMNLKDPAILWVASPLAGALAYQAIEDYTTRLLNPFARGAIGTGAGRDFNALLDPFAFPEYVERTVPDRLRDDQFDLERSLWTIGPVAERTSGALRAEIQRRVPELTRPRGDAYPRATAIDQRLGELLLGSSAETFRDLVGPEAFAIVAGLAVHRAFIRELSGDARSTAQAMQPGQFDAVMPHWAVLEAVFGRPFYSPRSGSTSPRERLALRLEVARSAAPWWALKGLAIVSERPLKIRHDTEGRLHSDSGPAMAFADGFTLYAWHGVSVDRAVIEAPDRMTVEMIDKESNAERRRVMVERFGADRMVREGGAELIHADATGKLWLRKMPFDHWQREPVVVVEVENSTPEADGSRKTYFLRVPPNTRTAREAVAWTFGMRPEQYREGRELRVEKSTDARPPLVTPVSARCRARRLIRESTARPRGRPLRMPVQSCGCARQCEPPRPLIFGPSGTGEALCEISDGLDRRPRPAAWPGLRSRSRRYAASSPGACSRRAPCSANARPRLSRCTKRSSNRWRCSGQ